MHSCKVWQLKEKNTKTLEATKINFWRRAAGENKKWKESLMEQFVQP